MAIKQQSSPPPRQSTEAVCRAGKSTCCHCSARQGLTFGKWAPKLCKHCMQYKELCHKHILSCFHLTDWLWKVAWNPFFIISADPSLRGSAPRSLVCVCLVPDHTPAGVRVFRKRSFSTCCATFRHFFYLLFRMAWVRIWMLFECFGSASPRALEAGDSSFLVRSVGDVSAVFRAAVSHGLGPYSLGINPAAVPLFRKRFSKSFLFRMVWASILLAFLRVP